MSEDIQASTNETPEPPKEILALGIYIKPDGTIRMDGTCLNDRTLAYGLLEVMRDEVQARYAMIRMQEQQRIVKANGHNMMSFIRGKK